MNTTNPIEPVVKHLDVNTNAHTAFAVFVERIGRWWPLTSHSISPEAEGAPAADCKIEPRVGGRVFEVGPSGQEYTWGEVTVYEPGARICFTWHLSRSAEEASEVDVVFEEKSKSGSASTHVTLTHRNWENFGDTPRTLRDGYNEGWDHVFGECYANAVDAAA